MSEKKYYTPSIEEFHVGFEYEISYDGETYQSKVVDDSDELHRIKTAIESLWVRVKHLDREDIKSLGWKYVPATKTFELIDLAGYEWELIFIPQTLSVDIDLYKGNPFSGTIRNKSELATIMRMIGIKN